MCEQVAAGPWPAVLEVAAADHEHEQAGGDEHSWPAELASLAADGSCDGGPGYGCGGQHGQYRDDQQRGGHQVHGLRDAAVSRDRPLHANSQLGPHRRASKARRRTAGCDHGQACPGGCQGVKRMTSQAGSGQPGAQPADRDVGGSPPAGPLLGELSGEQLSELVAVPRPPGAGVAQQQPPFPAPAPTSCVLAGAAMIRAVAWGRRGNARGHVSVQLPASRLRPTSATFRCARR